MKDKEILAQTEKRMAAGVADMQKKLATVRTGRASISVLDGVTVDYYGTPTPLNQVAKLSVPEATMIVAQPFDATMLPAIEKAIKASDLGLNPSNDGKLVRIPIPSLTEERRKQLAKKVRTMAEDAKTVIRQVRRESNDELKRLERDSLIAEDDARRGMEHVQKATDKHIGQIDELCAHKENDLMAI